MDSNVEGVEQAVSTGTLPGRDQVDSLVAASLQRNRTCQDGDVADYIPVLARADPDLFGVCVVEVDGGVHVAGDSDVEFSIQSISKAFVYALMPGTTADEQWAAVQSGLSAFAGRDLALDDEVYRSEAATNTRNRAIARLLESYGRIGRDPLAVVDVYTKQCSLRVSARDLAIMGATLADGGVNPVTGKRVVSAEVCRDTLAVLAANGLYERSSEWLFEIGLPGTSGVSGGLLTVSPGKAGIGAFSPRLDPAGNSVRGQQATAYLSRVLGLNIFASQAHAPGAPTS